MDLSGSLAAVAGHILREPPANLDLWIHRPSAATLGRTVAVVNLSRDDGIVKASAVAHGAMGAVIKALAELGEELVRRREGLATRSGLAGGLVRQGAAVRAQAELVERDAFLFHYRGGMPFSSCERIGELLAFSMDSAIDGFECVLVTDADCAEGRGDCLVFGTGAHPDRAAATEKAACEYVTLRLNHLLRPGFCRDVPDPPAGGRLADFHHAASRDARNRARFSALCAGPPGVSRTQALGAWRITDLPSPLRYFTYVRAEHPGIMAMDFGMPERFTTSVEPPIFHPFW